jgi:hypothetical protein
MLRGEGTARGESERARERETGAGRWHLWKEGGRAIETTIESTASIKIAERE